METKINISELLKDCPKGMELDCAMYDSVSLFDVKDPEYTIFPITVIRKDGSFMGLTKYGQYSNADFAKCIIFPKGKTTWEGFVPPCKFKDGDVVSVIMYPEGTWIGIFKRYEGLTFISHCCLNTIGEFIDVELKNHSLKGVHLATEEEKQKLFQAIKNNGYNWNAETKTLEKLIKPKFQVGNTIQDKTGYKVKITEVNVEDACYEYESVIFKSIGSIGFKKQDNWKLVPNKFDITTLVPFESKVLVRDGDNQNWKPAIWGFYDINESVYKYEVEGGVCFTWCIPYEGNEHLLGTKGDCDEYYKTWKR